MSVIVLIVEIEADDTEHAVRLVDNALAATDEQYEITIP